MSSSRCALGDAVVRTNLAARLLIVASGARVELQWCDLLSTLKLELLGFRMCLGEILLLLEEDLRDLVGQLLVQRIVCEEEVWDRDGPHLLVKALVGARRDSTLGVDLAVLSPDIIYILSGREEHYAVSRGEVADGAGWHASSPEKRVYCTVADCVHRLVYPELLSCYAGLGVYPREREDPLRADLRRRVRRADRDRPPRQVFYTPDTRTLQSDDLNRAEVELRQALGGNRSPKVIDAGDSVGGRICRHKS